MRTHARANAMQVGKGATDSRLLASVRGLGPRVRSPRVKDSGPPMFWRAVQVAFGCVLVAAVALPACGGNSATDGGAAASANGDDSGAAGARPSAARGGSSCEGGSAPIPKPVACGHAMCAPVVLKAAGNFAIPGCCADADSSTCGLDSSVLAMFGPTFAEACQPLAQPGVIDTSCPQSPEQPIADTGLTLKFDGCCRASGQCGYELDSIGGAILLGLGCVDSSPFLDGGTPLSCGDAAGGEGGAGGAGSVSRADAGAAGTGVP